MKKSVENIKVTNYLKRLTCGGSVMVEMRKTDATYADMTATINCHGGQKHTIVQLHSLHDLERLEEALKEAIYMAKFALSDDILPREDVDA